MKISRDDLTLVYGLIVIPLAIGFALAKTAGVRLWLAIVVTAIVVDGALILAYWLFMHNVGRNRQPVATLDDEEFGRIALDQPGTWTAYQYFAPVDESILIFIDGSAGGPTTAQRALFRTIRDRYASLATDFSQALARFVQSEFDKLSDRPPRFELTAISIPGSAAESEWSADFALESDKFTVYTVEVKYWQITEVWAGD